ncbi:hypothetical protein AX15_007780 [Amanita polypyramis BW_CC]|nr:hypothetical protein AX15_007780 [Amanita polypyramis BW_CC]
MEPRTIDALDLEEGGVGQCCNQVERGEVGTGASRAPRFARPADMGTVTPSTAGCAEGRGLVDEPGLSATREWAVEEARESRTSQWTRADRSPEQPEGRIKQGFETKLMSCQRGWEQRAIRRSSSETEDPSGRTVGTVVKLVDCSLEVLQVQEGEGLLEGESPVTTKGNGLREGEAIAEGPGGHEIMDCGSVGRGPVCRRKEQGDGSLGALFRARLTQAC